jgi:hypothetical protein
MESITIYISKEKYASLGSCSLEGMFAEKVYKETGGYTLPKKNYNIV